MTRTVDAGLWCHADPHVVEARVTLRNRGATEAVVDKIEVLSPKGSLVGWSENIEEMSGTHETRIIAPPGKSVGCGMIIRLPKPYSEVEEIRFRCRIAASNQWRRYRWIKGRAMMTSAVPAMSLLRSEQGT